VWPDPEVEALVTRRLIPARVHVKDDAAQYAKASESFGVSWTPTVLLIEPQGVERHRIEGFLPTEEFLPQLLLGLGQIGFHAKRYDEAAAEFDAIVRKYPRTEAAPEAQYWAGVARYKGSGDAKELGAITKAFEERYQDTVWAKKASVWKRA
jgi:hypothetical protein